MSREDLIIDAGIEFTEANCPNMICGGKLYEETRFMNRSRAFKEGAKWADSYPNWILCSEKLPEESKDSPERTYCSDPVIVAFSINLKENWYDTTQAWYDYRTNEWFYNIKCPLKYVIAWMKMPKY